MTLILLAGCASARTAAASSPTRANLAPSTRFSFSQLSLTLPVDADSGSGGSDGTQRPAAEVSTAQLRSGFSDPWFYLDEQGDLVLTAPANGAVTTPGVGSDHVRSELREQYSGPDEAADDSWTSQLGGTLRVVVQADAVAAQSREITIGQIHGKDGDAFVLLKLEPKSHKVLVSVYGNPGAASSKQTTVAKSIHLGQKITYTLAFSGGVVTVTVNGRTRHFTESAWASYPVHFAFGAYSSAPNTGNSRQAKSQVAITSFQITH